MNSDNKSEYNRLITEAAKRNVEVLIAISTHERWHRYGEEAWGAAPRWLDMIDIAEKFGKAVDLVRPIIKEYIDLIEPKTAQNLEPARLALTEPKYAAEAASAANRMKYDEVMETRHHFWAAFHITIAASRMYIAPASHLAEAIASFTQGTTYTGDATIAQKLRSWSPLPTENDLMNWWLRERR